MQNLSQRDSKWASIALGTSTNTTIGSHGCTITCIAMAAGVTPDEVNRRMNNAGAYANTNLVDWTKLQAAIPWLQFEWRNKGYSTDADNQRVKDAIAKNGFCLVEVDFDRIPTTNDRHWVLYIGNGQMIDPWTGVQKATTYYPAVGYSIINKIGEPESATDEYSGLDLTNRASMIVACQVWADVVKYGKYVSKADFDKKVQELADKQKALDEAIQARDDAKLAQTRSEEAMDGFRRENNQFIAELATVYQCRQEKPEILAEAKKSITFEDMAGKLQDTLDQERADYATNLKTMRGEIEDLQKSLEIANKKLADLEANKPTNVITSEQVTSIIDRFISWLKGRSK